MIEIVLGFLIATIVGMTGMGGGSFTTPALILLIGLPTGQSVGTAMVFAAILRMLAAPFYVVKRNVSLRLLGLLLLGATPGLLLGTWLLHYFFVESWKASAIVVVGILLTFSAAATFVPKFRNQKLAKQKPRWLAFLSFPIGVEMGFSSAGAGALGTLLMLNFTEMSVPAIVGTDLLFGIGLSLVGGTFHFLWGAVNSLSLTHLLMGGVPGVLFGCMLANRVPAKRLRTAIAVIAIVLGLQLVWSGGQLMMREHALRQTEANAKLKDKDVTSVKPASIATQR